ncbi:MAG: FMN-binding protein [Faecalibacterium sp.]
MEKISRKGFLKVAAAAAMSGVTAGALAACNSAASSSTAASGDAIYTAGTYTGTATGIGEVKVTMTFSETAITEVVIDASNETESIGGVAAPTLQEAIMAAQGTEIDNISGATVTTNAVKKAAASCIEQAMGVKTETPAAEPLPTPANDWLGERAGDRRARSLRRRTLMWSSSAAASVRCLQPPAQLAEDGVQRWPSLEKS